MLRERQEMADPITLVTLTALIIKNTPVWFKSLRGTILDKNRDTIIDKGNDFAIPRDERFMRRVFQLDEKERLRHLEQALKNATERGLATFDTLQERDLYKTILQTLSQPGPQSEALRQEVLHLFTISETPDLVKLGDIYNQRQRFSNAIHQDIDVAPYLNSFFNALVGELYADTYFRTQLSDVLQQRAATGMQQSLLGIVNALKDIGEILEESYTAEDFARDVANYTAHIERTMRNLKIVGVVPKDQNVDPKIRDIFIPLRIAFNEQTNVSHRFPNTLVTGLEQHPYLVLLGGPGSGKSIAMKHLAWSHAAANQSALAYPELLSGNPLPLHIELRRLNEERRRENYDFISFVTEVLLKREGVKINPQMFEELLMRRCMLLLFDGLDEVATLDERLGLVDEIEHFALHYPGNRVLVTSRPVGYDLARISYPLFYHAQVQNFNDEQIQRFLENWYTAVLQLSPIPQRDQEELDLLLTTLQENPRLHKLAENPLLLTVIAALHHYERLPDRRVLVYDRCADLLLETWARLRGTDKRWTGMKMIKEEQYACVAYLAFLLQEETSGGHEEDEDITVDVTSRFLRNNVEDFLKKRELVVGIGEQKAESKRFIELIQVEAGLIVERGTDENGEALYSFVHRTFQEYFAAADVYERYQQQEDAKVISDFLSEHLHDPHWSEVILLLLGKLKSKPVTNQLQRILQGQTKSLRSDYTEILQQDLFFICDCLLEEIGVEFVLVNDVLTRLKEVIIGGWFLSQRKIALHYLGRLMQTRRYAGIGKKELMQFVTREITFDVAISLEATQVFYLYTIASSEERRLATEMLRKLLEQPNLSVEQVWETAVSLYQNSSSGSEEEQLATELLKSLLGRPNLSVEQMQQLAVSLYQISPSGSGIEQLATEMLKSLLERSDLSVEQVWETAVSLYQNSSSSSEAQQLATELLKSLLEQPDLSAEQVQQTAVSLYQNSSSGSETQQLATELLKSLLGRPNLSVEQVQQLAVSLYQNSSSGSEEEQLATELLKSLLGRPNLSVEQVQQLAVSLYQNSPSGSEAQQLATELLKSLLGRPNLLVEQVQQLAVSLYQNSPSGSEAQQLATELLKSLLERPSLSVEQVWEMAVSLYQNSPSGSEAQQLATELLKRQLKQPDLSVEQVWEAAVSLYQNSSSGSETEQLATEMLKRLLEQPDLSVEQVWETAVSLYHNSPSGSEAQRWSTYVLLSLFSSDADRARSESDLYYIFSDMIPQFDKIPSVLGMAHIQMIEGGIMRPSEEGEIVLRVSNSTRKTMRVLEIELQPSAEYRLISPHASISMLAPGHSYDVHFRLQIKVTSRITVNYHVNGRLMDPPLYIDVVRDNPYVYGSPVEGSEFLGRQEELEQLLQAVTKPIKQDTFIVGERRAGKTSMLKALERQLQLPFVPVLLTLTEPESNTTEVLNYILRQIVQRLITQKLLDTEWHTTHHYSYPDFIDKVYEVLQAVQQKLAHITIILLLDEADALLNISDELQTSIALERLRGLEGQKGERVQKILRAALQSSKVGDRLRAVVAGTTDFSAYIVEYSSPFFNHFRFMYLKPLNSQEIRVLIEKPASRLGYTYTSDAIQRIVALSGSLPYYCQALCYEAFASAQRRQTQSISNKDVDAAEEKIINDLYKGYLSSFWHPATIEERKFLVALVKGKAFRVSHELVEHLLGWQLIIKTEKGYAFSSGLFARWTVLAARKG
jgi:Cdc6-like AAA superfamily ATPase